MHHSDSSVKKWVKRLQAGERDAAQPLWEVFFDRLVHLAHGRLNARHRKVHYAEDIALSAFDSFCRGVEQGRFPNLADRDDLWRLLVAITIHKVLHVVRDERRQKRGGHLRQLAAENGDGAPAIEQLVGREPTPEFAAQLADEYRVLVEALDDEELMQLAGWKLEGYTNQEIATKWGRAVRMVERKLRLIRKIWLTKMS